jgi:hypothetical protein
LDQGEIDHQNGSRCNRLSIMSVDELDVNGVEFFGYVAIMLANVN